jgi:hypothetical protein
VPDRKKKYGERDKDRKRNRHRKKEIQRGRVTERATEIGAE